METAFENAGKIEGLELWRIENFALARITEVKGKFHVGDAYILLSTVLPKSGGALKRAIHFWLGSTCSQDESGVAAVKAVELDNQLGGSPVQYREIEGHESPLFLSYFKDTGGLEYVPGGVASGFNVVERGVYKTRLLQLKGERTVRVKEVALSADSLNQGDVFILDKGLHIIIYNGPSANMWEKAKGIEVASLIDSDERSGLAVITHLQDSPENPDFWDVLGGFRAPETLPMGEADVDILADKKTKLKMKSKLLKMNDDNTLEDMNEQVLKREMLLSDNVFLLHCFDKLFLWVGNKAKVEVKKDAMEATLQYMKQNDLPVSMSVMRVGQGVETTAFKNEFCLWYPPQSFSVYKYNKNATTKEDEHIDIQNLLALKNKNETSVDDGSGKIEIWRVTDFKKEEVNHSTYGQFYGGDSYIILYTYLKSNQTKYIIYFWLGNTSSTDEKGSAALLAMELDDSLGGRPVQVRVCQGKEPLHFRQLFQGKMITYTGGKQSSFRNTDEKDSMDEDGVGMFQVKGTALENILVSQIKEHSSSLNSEDVFLLVTPLNVFIWQGVYAMAEEIEVGHTVGGVLANTYMNIGGRTIIDVVEGEESEYFWSFIGGKGDYSKTPAGEMMPKEARLFHLSTATGNFKAVEIFDFNQTDLNDEDVYLLDTYTQLFLWLGKSCSEEEKKKSDAFADQFVTEANDGRDATVPVIKVPAGSEPLLFTSHFFAWDEELIKTYVDVYQQKLDKLKESKQLAMESPKKEVQATLKSPSLTPPKPDPVLSSPEPAYGKDLKSPPPPSLSPPKPDPVISSPEFSVDYLTKIKRNNLTKTSLTHTNLTSPIPAFAKLALKPVLQKPSAEGGSDTGPTKPASPKSWGSEKSDQKLKNEKIEKVLKIGEKITTFYSVEILKDNVPLDVDLKNKELYLNDDDFKLVFKMDIIAFNKLPQWKKVTLKKNVGLF